MTRDTWSGPAEYVVTPGATYPVPWPYEDGALKLALLSLDGRYVDLAPAHWAVTPVSSATGGSLSLSPEMAALYAGGRLLMERDTSAEQGWAGTFSARERGIEGQLDVLAMAAQEAKSGVDRSLRFAVPVSPIAPVPGAILILDAMGQPQPGPPAVHILQVEAYVAGAAEASETAVEAAQQARDHATVAAAAAAATVPSLGALLASSSPTPVGTVIMARADGQSYQVVDSAPQMTTAGGVGLVERGPRFSSRTRLAEAVTRGLLASGMTVTVGAETYVVDTTATGYDSALQDLGINGVRRADRLENLFLAAHFTDQDDTTIHISASMDGVHFSLLNKAALPGSAAFELSQRDPAIIWFSGWWWLFGTGGNPGTHDFVLYRSRDLTSWSKHQVAMAGGPYYSSTVPMPGGVSPANAIWAPEPFVENGIMRVMVSIRYGADFTNIYGDTQQHFRPYLTTLTDPDAMSFSAPAAMSFGPAYPSNVRQWDQASGTAIAPTTPLRHQAYTNGFSGFETSLMAHLARAYPGDTILLVPAAKGGSGFTGSDVEHSFLPGGDARVGLEARINAALAAHPGATIEGMFWQQGEQDRNNAQYQTDLTSFLTYVRTTWPALATRPVIMGEMGSFVAPGTTNVNAVIAAVAATRTNYGTASSLDLTDKGDSLHFDAPSNRVLGDRHFAAWQARRGTLPGGSGATRIFIISGQSNAVGLAAADTTYAAGTSKIDPSVVKHAGRYYCAVKDSVYRTVQIYSASALAGPYAYSQTLTGGTLEIEAPCLTRVRDRAAINGEARRDKWRVYVDNNRTGVADAIPNTLVGAPYYFEAIGAPDAAYGAMNRAYFDTPVRHGSVINLAELPPEAARSVATIAAAGGRPRPNLAKQIELGSGAQTIRPQPDAVYYASVNSGAVSLTIRNGPADRFYLAVFSGLSAVGINVLTGSFVNRGFILGFGRGNDTVLEMRRRVDGTYYPVGLVRRGEFAADKGGTAQGSLAAGQEHTVTWPNAARNFGGYFNPATGRFTPPAGRVDLQATVLMSGLDAGVNNYVAIKRNGVLWQTTYFHGGPGQASGTVVVSGAECTGTDYFEVVTLGGGTTAKSLSGADYATTFSGTAW